MKTFKSLSQILIFIILLASCEKPGNNTEMNPLDESDINGQLCYTANPFSPETDTILCLNNIYLAFKGDNYEYCSYVRNLLLTRGGVITPCRHGSEHSWEYFEMGEQYFYPICSKQFISLIDSNTGKIADSIILNDRTIFPKQKRNGDNDRVTRFYIGDFVRFMGSDSMKPKFITDSITTSSDTIVCFDGLHGPFEGDSSIINSTVYILDE